MPRLDGIETTKALRSSGNDLPILVLTARDSVGDRVEGLDAGADDYLVKPFDLDELLARARAVIRRRTGRASPRIVHGALVLDPARREVSFRGAPVEMVKCKTNDLEVPAHAEIALEGYIESAYAVSVRDAYAQLKVNSNWLAVEKNRRDVSALPSVMSLRAARFNASRPKVERWRARA